MQSTPFVRLGSVSMLAVLVLSAASALFVLSTHARAACVPTLNGCGGGGVSQALESLGTHLVVSSSASAAEAGLTQVPPPPILPPTAQPDLIEYALVVALIAFAATVGGR
jgi:hypothetical protein